MLAVSVEFPILIVIFFVIAFFYASVGFGGGSSYLAILSIAITSFFLIRTTALVCNLVVVSGSCVLLYKKGHLDFKKFLPFVLASIPLAFLGATYRLKEKSFFLILGISLVASAIILLQQSLSKKQQDEVKNYPAYMTYVLGGAIGLLSGLVGIGGGIFLAPVLNHLKWDKPIVIAALASFFILVNSISGLVGLTYSGTFSLQWPEILGLIAAVFLGGQLGIRTSIFRFSPKTIRIMTALLVLVAGGRILFKHWMG